MMDKKILIILKRILSIALGSGMLFLLILIFQSVFHAPVPFRDFTEVLYFILLCGLCASIIVFVVLWNTVKSKFVYLLFFIPVLSIAAMWLINAYPIYAHSRERAQMEAERAQIKLEKQVQLLGWLKEHRAYPRGFFIDHSVIYILTIGNNYPIIKNIDIFEGELIIKSRFSLDTFIDRAWRGYGPQFQFSSDDGVIGFSNNVAGNLFVDNRTPGERRRSWRHNLRFVEKIDRTIPEEVFWLTMDSQVPYTGFFAFDELQIIGQYNYEISEEDFNRVINIVLREDGFLTGINFPLGRFTSRYGTDSFRITAEDKRIGWTGANGPFGSRFFEWYFYDRNTIYHRYSVSHHPFDFDTGAILPGGYFVKYVVRYVRQ